MQVQEPLKFNPQKDLVIFVTEVQLTVFVKHRYNCYLFGLHQPPANRVLTLTRKTTATENITANCLMGKTFRREKEKFIILARKTSHNYASF